MAILNGDFKLESAAQVVPALTRAKLMLNMDNPPTRYAMRTIITA